jgi:putative peptidoglycan lipid II flippase
MGMGTLASRLTGQIRTILLVAAIGSYGQIADAFDIANNVPTSLNLILTGGIFNAVLLPQIVKFRTQKNKAKSQEQINKLLTFAGSIVFLVTLLLTLLTPLIIRLIANTNWGQDQINLAITFGFWCMPQVFFYGMYTILGNILQSEEKFGIFSLAPILNNIISIIIFTIFIILTGGFGVFPATIQSMTPGLIVLLAGGATLGIAAQAAILIIPLLKSGFKFKFIFSLHGFGLRQISKLCFWTFWMVMIEQVASLFYVHLCSGAPEAAAKLGQDPLQIGGNAAYSNAMIIYIIPQSLITISLMTALFTKISQAVSKNQTNQVISFLIKGCTSIIALITPFIAILVVLGEPLSKALIPTLDKTGQNFVSLGVISLSLMLIPTGVFSMFTRAFFAYQKTHILTFIEIPEHLLTMLIAFLATLFFQPKDWLFAVGLCRSVGAWIFMFVIILIARKFLFKKSISESKIYSSIIRCVLAGIISALTGVAFGNLIFKHLLSSLGQTGGWLYSVFVCFLIGTIMLIVYVIMAYIFRVQEIQNYITLFKNKLFNAKKNNREK